MPIQQQPEGVIERARLNVSLQHGPEWHAAISRGAASLALDHEWWTEQSDGSMTFYSSRIDPATGHGYVYEVTEERCTCPAYQRPAEARDLPRPCYHRGGVKVWRAVQELLGTGGPELLYAQRTSAALPQTLAASSDDMRDWDSDDELFRDLSDRDRRDWQWDRDIATIRHSAQQERERGT